MANSGESSFTKHNTHANIDDVRTNIVTHIDSHRNNDPRLTPLEAEVLAEYATLRDNLDLLSARLADLAAAPSSGIADTLRLLERKTSLVCTALKSSVYGIVLQQSIEFAGDADHTVAVGREDDGE